MLEKESLKLSPYEYLKAYDDKKFTPSQNGEIKGLAILTDEQYVFFGKTRNNDQTHYDIAMDIEAYIHPNRPSFMFTDGLPNHTYIFITPKEAIIELPENHHISEIQVDFLLDFLQDLTKYNEEVEDKKRIPFAFSWNHIKLPYTYHIEDIPEEVITKLREWIIPTPPEKKERIIGKTLIEENEKIKEQWLEIKGGIRK